MATRSTGSPWHPARTSSGTTPSSPCRRSRTTTASGEPSPAPDDLPPDLLRYTLPSRYCDSDKLVNFAWEKFGRRRARAGRACRPSASGSTTTSSTATCRAGADISAWDVLSRGYGVCRDFAHLAIALNRTFNVPARYVTGHLPDIGFPDPGGAHGLPRLRRGLPGREWFTTTRASTCRGSAGSRLSCGLDAVDGAFSTIYGGATLSYFEVWAYQVARGAVGVGDPLDLSLRLDNQWAVRRDPGRQA